MFSLKIPPRPITNSYAKTGQPLWSLLQKYVSHFIYKTPSSTKQNGMRPLTNTKSIVSHKSSCPYHKKGIQSYMKLKFTNYSYDIKSYTKAIRVKSSPNLLPPFKLPRYYFLDDFERQSGS